MKSNQYISGLILSLVFLISINSTAQVQLLNDEFNDGNTLTNWVNINQAEGWNITQLEAHNINDSTPDQFFIKPITESWFGEYRGAFLYKYISGDFILTTEVTATGRDGVSLPSSTYSLAGLMIREPLGYTNAYANPGGWEPNAQNYIFMSLGQATGPGWDFEIKNTVNSNSCLNIVPINFNTAKIRMARIGNEIIVLSRFPGEDWVVRSRYNRSTASCGGQTSLFSDTLQIGFVSYTDWEKISTLDPAFQRSTTLHPDSLVINGIMDPSPGTPFNPDIIANFDYARFDTIPQALYSLILTGAGAVDDATLLTHLGYATSPFCVNQFIITDPISNQIITTSAIQSITANNLINQNSNVIYAAGEVNLLEGFEVQGSSLFEVILSGCIH